MHVKCITGKILLRIYSNAFDFNCHYPAKSYRPPIHLRLYLRVIFLIFLSESSPVQADIHTLFTSDFYRILDFKCRCTDCTESDPEYGDSFCISFVRKGNFLFHVFRNSFHAYNGSMLITKPGYEHSVTHQHIIPDECTIIEFTREFYSGLQDHYGQRLAGFFKNHDLHSLMLKTTAETEYLHSTVLQKISDPRPVTLEIDSLVMEIAASVMHMILHYKPSGKIADGLKKNHLATVERAKEYLNTHFTTDISLFELAKHCYVSPFHFSRIFKMFTSTSPHQYIMQLRLKHAELLIKNTSFPVSDIAFTAGFNSTVYFSAAFRQKYRHAPARFRSLNAEIQKSKIS